MYFEKIKVAAEWISKSKKPVIICGGGIRNADGIDELKELSSRYNIPVAVTFNGTDSFDHLSPHFFGLVGTMGNASTNKLIQESDLVLAIGTRLSLRQVKGKPKKFAENANLVHVDIDSAELDQRVPTDLSVCCDAKIFLQELIKDLEEQKVPNFSNWNELVRQAYENNPFCNESYYTEKNVNPYVFMKTLSHAIADNDIIVADAGQNVMWAIQAIEVHGNQRLFTAAAHSPMGYSLPAAMGAAVEYRNGNPNVICTIGDGAIQLNIQELQTLFSYKLPVKVFVLNNHSYGAIMDYQDQELGKRYYASSPEYGYSIPNIIGIAKAYNIQTYKISTMKNLKKEIQKVVKMSGPILCEVELGERTFVTLDTK